MRPPLQQRQAMQAAYALQLLQQWTETLGTAELVSSGTSCGKVTTSLCEVCTEASQRLRKFSPRAVTWFGAAARVKCLQVRWQAGGCAAAIPEAESKDQAPVLIDGERSLSVSIDLWPWISRYLTRNCCYSAQWARRLDESCSTRVRAT